MCNMYTKIVAENIPRNWIWQHQISNPFPIDYTGNVAVWVVEFSNVRYKIRKFFAWESTYPKEIIEFEFWINGKLSKSGTGSTIRFWHKVKAWLDQMFWQMYQKLMLSGFLSSGNLCLIHHMNFFWPHTASTASDRKGGKIQHEFLRFCQKIFFSKYQNKDLKLLNSRTWKTSEVLSSDFSGLRNLSSLIDLSSLCNLSGLNSL